MNVKKEEKVNVSIIMSCFNSENTVGFAIESILNQTIEDFEFLIFDDGSTDNTKDIIKGYKDSRIIFFHSNDNEGLTKRLAFLAKESRGEFLARQDDDDYSLPSRLETQINFLKKNKKYSACTTASFLKNSFSVRPRYSKYLPKKLAILIKNPFIHGAFVIRLKDFIEVGGYNTDYKYSQDYKLYLDLYKKNKKIKFMFNPMYVLNSNGRISSENKLSQNSYKKLALRSYLGFNS